MPRKTEAIQAYTAWMEAMDAAEREVSRLREHGAEIDRVVSEAGLTMDEATDAYLS